MRPGFSPAFPVHRQFLRYPITVHPRASLAIAVHDNGSNSCAVRGHRAQKNGRPNAEYCAFADVCIMLFAAWQGRRRRPSASLC